MARFATFDNGTKTDSRSSLSGGVGELFVVSEARTSESLPNCNLGYSQNGESTDRDSW